MGIGPKTVGYLESTGIYTIGQLSGQPLEWFLKGFGKRGISMFNKAQGTDTEPVRSERTSQSVSVEGTFSEDLYNPDEIYIELSKFAKRLSDKLMKKSLKGKTITLKLRLNNLTILNRQSTLSFATCSEQTIRDIAWKLALPEITSGRTFRLIGIGVSQFPLAEQLALPI
jgi:DNA polymerase-4